jgi:HlyD family secretion protein
MTRRFRWIAGGVAAVALALAAVVGWYLLHSDGLGDAIASGNGRIEARELDVAAKSPGRIRTILVDEGDMVKAGQILATIDTDALEAQRAQASAQLQATLTSVAAARMQVAQAVSQHAAVVAQLKQRQADLSSAERHLARSSVLAREGASARQEEDDDQARVDATRATVDAARAQVDAAASTVDAARAQVTGAEANVMAARAAIQRLDADIADAVLRAPRNGRVQYRIAEPGEVVGAGGRVLNIVDLSDVYMTFFLPEKAAGRVALGSEARIVVDAAPDRPIPARISFVADVAQFTPKSVETKDEREKLMFRVKAQIDPALLARYHAVAKTGVPGMAYVRLDPAVAWPAKLVGPRQQ